MARSSIICERTAVATDERHGHYPRSTRCFLLEGIGGVYNYGCEAIVRGTARAIWHADPGAKVVYVSHRAEADRQALEGTRVRVVNRASPWYRFRKQANRVLRRLRIGHQMLADEYRGWLERPGCVLSIGGDMFTLWRGEEHATHFPIAEHAREIMNAGKPLVLWGASVGPFDANPHAVEAYRDVLSRMRLIVVREPVTLEYLRRLGVTSPLRLAPDPAFVMEVERSNTVPARHRSLVAVNLSPLSVEYGLKGASIEAAAVELADWIEGMVRRTDADVALVPHVICPERPEDDDYGFLKRIQETLSDEASSRVQLLPPDLGALRTKAFLAGCTAAVAARMHCAIAAMSMGVPTLLLSYSPKSVGMCQYVYGSRDWVVPLSAGKEEVMRRLDELIGRGEAVRSVLQERVPQLKAEALCAGKYLIEAVTPSPGPCS